MLADKLKLIRATQKITQERLAQLACTSAYRINKAEQHKTELRYSEIRSLLIELDLDPCEFFDLTKKTEYHDQKEMSSKN